MVDVNIDSSVNLSTFESLCNKVASLVYSRTDGDQKILSQLLDFLNGLDYNSFHVKKERALLLINQCCYIIPSDKTSLALKAAHLFMNLILKGCAAVEGKTLSLALNWCLCCLKNGNQIIMLKCLQVLAKGNGKKIEEQNNHILPELKKLSNNFTFDWQSKEVCLNCLRFIEAATCGLGAEEVLAPETIEQYFEIFRNVLLNGKNNSLQNDLMFFKFLISAMRGISNLILMSDIVITKYLDEVLGIIKAYMLYGLLGHENYEIQKLFPTSISVPEMLKSSQSLRKVKGKYNKKSKKVTVTTFNSLEEIGEAENPYVGFSEKNYQMELESNNAGPQTSDSDYSDSEHSHNVNIKSYESKVRHCALILLGTTVEKTNPRSFIKYMPSFLPDGSNFLHMRTLITCLQEDPSLRCRTEAVKVLLIIISNSRQYFLQADGMSKSSFTTFSNTISSILKELHKCLLMILNTEKNVTILKYILKCISDLIRCTPYFKVDPNLIIGIGKSVENFLRHRDINVQILALTIFGCIISIEPKCKEIATVIFNISDETESKPDKKGCDMNSSISDLAIYDEESELIEEKPWLLAQCINNLTKKSRFYDSDINVALQIESLQVIGALSRNFFRETIISFPKDIITLIKHCSNKDEYSIKLYTGKLMETILNSLQFSLCSEDEYKKPSMSLTTYFWETLLQGPIISLIQNQKEPMLRCVGCDCFANLGVTTQSVLNSSIQSSLIYDQLPRNKQILCVTLMFSCLRDEAPAVRSSAARALAIFVLFPSLRNDSLFLLDAIDATVELSKDKENSVRTQASWLFGNLSEAIIINKQKEVDDGVTEKFILQLLETGIKLSNTGPKSKPGSVRGIGNLLKIIDVDFIKKNKHIVGKSIEEIIKNATTGTFMKARWNSCYAIANFLQNPLIHANNEWMSKIFNVMLSLVQNYKNFKVRTGACLVLAALPDRQSYGDLYNSVWSAALNALENSKNISDFNEYQHRDQLVDQLCVVLCHLVTLIQPGDLNSLQDAFYFHLDNLKSFMTRFQDRVVPEKSDILLSATERISFLLNEKNTTAEEKSLLKILQQLFTYKN